MATDKSLKNTSAKLVYSGLATCSKNFIQLVYNSACEITPAGEGADIYQSYIIKEQKKYYADCSCHLFSAL